MDKANCVWRPVRTRTPLHYSPRWGHSTVLLKQHLLVFGGFANSNYLNDLWSFDLSKMRWNVHTDLSGEVPDPRSNFTANLYKEQMLIFGGGGYNKRRFNDVTLMTWPQRNWTAIPSSSTVKPIQRTYHIAQIFGDSLFVHGGEAYFDLDDLWRLDIESGEWHQVLAGGKKPSPRRFHSSCRIDSYLYIIGGCYSKYIALGDVFRIDLASTIKDKDRSPSWEQIKFSGSSAPLLTRWGHSSNYLEEQKKIFIFGGRFLDDLNDTVQIDTNTATVKSVRTQCFPFPRRKHTSVMIGNSLLMLGGYNSDYFNDFNYISLVQNKSSVPASTFSSDRQALLNMRMSHVTEMFERIMIKRRGEAQPTKSLFSYIYGGNTQLYLKEIMAENPGFQMQQVQTGNASRRYRDRLNFESKEKIPKMNRSNAKDNVFNTDLSLCTSVFKDFIDMIVISSQGPVEACSPLLLRSCFFRTAIQYDPKIVELKDWSRKAVQGVVNYLSFDSVISRHGKDVEFLLELAQLGKYLCIQRLQLNKLAQLLDQHNFQRLFNCACGNMPFLFSATVQFAVCQNLNLSEQMIEKAQPLLSHLRDKLWFSLQQETLNRDMKSKRANEESSNKQNIMLLQRQIYK